MAKIVRLAGARVALDAQRTERMDLMIHGRRILPFDVHAPASVELDLSGHLLLPGLINAHDHLEFNLFPRLGSGPYPNASVWAADIHKPDQPPLSEHLRIPKAVRLHWGGIKNLLSGVTTVAHHNPFEPDIFNDRFPVRVVRRFGWSHSLHFSPDLRKSFDSTPPYWPFIVHAAEGTDESAHAEIPRLREMGILDQRTILVHAVGMTPRALDAIRESRSSIVWCPTSNLFTLGRTLGPETLRSGAPVALGTDSALTGKGDLIDEIQCAAKISGWIYPRIYPMVTTAAARMLRLSGGQGTIVGRGAADLVAVSDKGQTPADALRNPLPEMVMAGGRVMLMSNRFAESRGVPVWKGFHPIHLEGRGSWLIRADVPRLFRAAETAIGSEVRLAGRRVCL